VIRRALLWLPLAGLALLVSLLVGAGPARAAETFGGGVSAGETTSIQKILADPDAYVGQRVRIEGQVSDVCPMKGCWMEIAEPEGDRLRVKVEDGVIIFPKDAKGKRAVAEGVLEELPMDREQYVRWMSHLAEERGETFDASKLGDGPFRILQLRGLGARIE
jgi:hypothetical protein